MVTFEEMYDILKNSGLEVNHKESEAGHFNRIVEVRFDGVTYLFEWWKNLINIYINKEDGVQIICNEIELSSTWPNRSNLNIQCSYNGKTMFVIPLKPIK